MNAIYNLFRLALIPVLLVASLDAKGLVVEITKGTIGEIPIAITPFELHGLEGTESAEDFADKLQDIVRADLSGCGFFRILSPRAFIQTQFAEGVRFQDWRAINAQVLVMGELQLARSNPGRFIVKFRIYDVFSREELGKVQFDAKISDWRRTAHKIADVIYQRVTGEKGYFDTRIVYVARAPGTAGRPQNRLAIMDQDGANHQYLSNGAQLVFTPRFSPTLHHLTYLDFGADWRTPRVYLMDTFSGQKRQLGSFNGMTLAPRFSPDGKSVIMSYSKDGASNLYLMHLASAQVRQLTQGNAIDVSGCYSPQGDNIVFNSDREGTQQLYVINANGDNIRRISLGGGRYASPVWSPRGDWIAFTKTYQGQFYIGIMRPDGSGERLITSSYIVEEPTWSPNGRVLMYTKKTSAKDKQRLYRIDLTGFNEHEVPTPAHEEALSPAWSPLLP